MHQIPTIISAPRTDPVYNCHAYLTKVPIDAIRPFIEAFTQPGEIVADFFAGSGMTGLAAWMLNRRARLSDISVLGKHICTGYLTDISDRAIGEASKKVIEKARAAIGTLYTTKRARDNAIAEIIRTVWSFTYQCPSCSFEMVYFKYVDAQGKPPGACPSCGNSFARRDWRRLEDVPVQVVVRTANERQTEQGVSEYDHLNIQQALQDPRVKKLPSLAIEEHREMYSRSGLGKSRMTETGKFFSPRNAIALLELWQAIESIDNEKIRKKLQFVFTAILPRASKRYQWSPKRPLNAQNQTYYIAPIYYEWNVFDLFNRKVNAAIKATDHLFRKAELFKSPATLDVTYNIASADRLMHLQDASIDYVFVDPPFGSNIFYSDMNLFQEAWLGETTDYTGEAVVYTTGKRKNASAQRYEMLLRKAFQEAWRVLKPGKYMSVIFGNSSGRIWGLVQRALRDAGFNASPVHVAILDKGQRSVKGLNSGSEGVVTVDLIMTVQKPLEGDSGENTVQLSSTDCESLIREAISELMKEEMKNPSYVYGSILRKAIERRLVLDHLHFTDVLVALSNAGYAVDRPTGLLRQTFDDLAPAGKAEEIFRRVTKLS